MENSNEAMEAEERRRAEKKAAKNGGYVPDNGGRGDEPSFGNSSRRSSRY